MPQSWPNEIIDQFLFLGNDRHAASLPVLQTLGITHVLCCAQDCELHFAHLPQFQYAHLALRDAVVESLSAHWKPAWEFLESVRAFPDGKVLVHCAQGVSRSATMVIGYLMATRKWSLKQAFDLCKSRREVVCPNLGFFFQLAELEMALLHTSSLKQCLPPSVDLVAEHARWKELLLRAGPSSAAPLVMAAGTGESSPAASGGCLVN